MSTNTNINNTNIKEVALFIKPSIAALHVTTGRRSSGGNSGNNSNNNNNHKSSRRRFRPSQDKYHDKKRFDENNKCPNLFHFLLLIFIRIREKPILMGGKVLFVAFFFFMIITISSWFFPSPSKVKSFDITKKINGRITQDYSQVNDMKHLKMKKDEIREWCLRGSEDHECSCSDPLIPLDRHGTRHWSHTHHMNTEMTLKVHSPHDLDVVFYGDSIIEQWHGTKMGYPLPKRADLPNIFEELFDTEHGARYNGLALGIGGDTSPNLLWRIQNGEMPDLLNPPIFWILIGTNDFGNSWCSPEIVLVGILQIIQYIQIHKPHAKIVVNSLLPRTFHRYGKLYHNNESPFRLHSGGPSLYDEITTVNQHLKEYCSTHENLFFFDATDLFLVSSNSVTSESPSTSDTNNDGRNSSTVEKTNDLFINSSKMDDFLHPTALGQREWGNKIVEFLEEILP